MGPEEFQAAAEEMESDRAWDNDKARDANYQEQQARQAEQRNPDLIPDPTVYHRHHVTSPLDHEDGADLLVPASLVANADTIPAGYPSGLRWEIDGHLYRRTRDGMFVPDKPRRRPEDPKGAGGTPGAAALATARDYQLSERIAELEEHA